MDLRALRAHARLSGLAGVTALGLLLASCGASGSSSSAAARPGPASSTSPGSAGSAATVTVTETEFKLALSRSTFTPGTYTFTAVNSGQATHALEIDGPGVEHTKTSTVSPGARTSITVRLEKGRYLLYCPVGNHKDLGMQTKIGVS